MAVPDLHINLMINVIIFLRIVNAQDYVEFPKGFKFGFATSAYQVEGGWNASDKGESVWDWFVHNKQGVIKDGQNGDIACDSYHRYKEDIALLKDLKVDYYRLSVSWTRVVPTGFTNKVSKDGIQYYKNVIDELHRNGIEPFITLFHWDHPEILERMGGWLNDLIVDWFADYARIIFQELGPKVKFFTTINEPQVLCNEAYRGGAFAPGKRLDDIANYTCMHNVLKAHAKAYRIYDEEFRATQGGYVSIVLPCSALFAKYSNDTVAEDVDFQFHCGWVAHPIFSTNGDYPEIMKLRIAENSKLQGYPRSRLPEFSKHWVEYIKGTADFFALNHYTSWIVESIPRTHRKIWYEDSGVLRSLDPSWLRATPNNWLYIVPEGFRRIINKIKTEYNNPPLYITENGIPDNGTLIDKRRIEYFYSYLKSMLMAIHVDGCDVRGYIGWSLEDNFEWISGYTEKFGIVHVDFNSPNRTRTPKLSFKWWKNAIKNRKLPPNYETFLKQI